MEVGENEANEPEEHTNSWQQFMLDEISVD